MGWRSALLVEYVREKRLGVVAAVSTPARRAVG
jgi:hypothetical protein